MVENATLAGGTVVVGSAATIGGDADIAASLVQVQGRIARNLSLAAAEAQIAGQVGGSVRAHAQQLTLLPGALIHGNLVVYSPKPPTISPEARVLGRVEHHPVARPPERRGPSFSWPGCVLSFLWLLSVGSAAIALSRRWVASMGQSLLRRPAAAIGLGFLVLFCVPVLSLVLLVTVVGLPLAAVLMALYVLVLILGAMVTAYALGGWLLKRLGRGESSPYAALAVGVLAVSVLVGLPGLGWFFQLLFAMAGAGALALERRGLFLRLRAEGIA